MSTPLLPQGGPSRWLIFGLYTAAAFFLIGWHWRHLVEALPFLVVLACPLMHAVMHRGHHNHRSDAPAPPGVVDGPVRGERS
jgi:hypothetical protein